MTNSNSSCRGIAGQKNNHRCKSFNSSIHSLSRNEMQVDLFALSLFSKFLRGMWISLFQLSRTSIVYVCFFVYQSRMDPYGFKFCSFNKRKSHSAQILLSPIVLWRTKFETGDKAKTSIGNHLKSTHFLQSFEEFYFYGVPN